MGFSQLQHFLHIYQSSIIWHSSVTQRPLFSLSLSLIGLRNSYLFQWLNSLLCLIILVLNLSQIWP